MQQTFYIDRDEEITSLVDRLKKTKATENIFVVPERAAILQSIVSLKLLKKEAEKLQKQISIVTTDSEGKLKIEKAGITIGSANSVSRKEAFEEDFENEIEKNIKQAPIKKMEPKMEGNKTARLEKLGTNSFFGNGNEENKISQPNALDSKINLKNSANSFSYQEKNTSEKSQSRAFDSGSVDRKTKIFSEMKREEINSMPNPISSSPRTDLNSRNAIFSKPVQLKREFSSPENYEKSKIQYGNGIDPHKEEMLNGLFTPYQKPAAPEPRKRENKNKEKRNLDVPVSKNLKKFFIIFAIISLFAILGAASYVMLPKATVGITLKNNYFEGNLELKGDVNAAKADTANLIIPSRIVELSDTLNYTVQTTGTKSMPGEKKAQGKVIIYNEFSNESQSLVATTRLQTEDGKIFRLVKAITVPGMSNENNPGSVEADVVADQGGDAYNIGPSDFKIPGFQGSPKYDKFYAKSADSMSGGGGEGSGIKIISQQDLDSAKKNAEKQIRNNLIEKVKSGLAEGETLLDEASQINIAQSKTTAKANQTVDSFNYDVQASIKSIVFSENDVKTLFAETKSKEQIPSSDITISYNQSSVNFENGSILIEAHGKFENKYQIDSDDLKNKLLGKNAEEVKNIMSNYSQIQSIDLQFWPQLITSKIPKNPKRVEVTIN
jgi:hypothetical protein